MSEYANHTQAEFLTDSARIARLERQMASLRDDVLKIKAIVGEFDDNLNATDYTLGMGINDLRQTVEYLRNRLEASQQPPRFTPQEAAMLAGMMDDPQVARVIADHAAYYELHGQDGDA